MEHWIIESGIVLLGIWAVWKSLPRDPDISWAPFQEDLRQCLLGASPSEPVFPKPFTLLEWTDISSDSERLRDYLSNRLKDWIVVGEDAHLLGWGDNVSMRVVACDWQDSKEILSQLEEQLEDRSQRFVFVAKGSQANDLIAFLHALSLIHISEPTRPY